MTPSDNAVLVACEESQVVTSAFRARGIEAWSCDTEPCSGGHPEWHLQQDVTPLLQRPWAMILAFPPCTHLSTIGSQYWPEKQRTGQQQRAARFFWRFVQVAEDKCAHVAIENPVGVMSRQYRKPDQIIHPWQFGEPVAKRTCLWLRGLPRLRPSRVIEATHRQIDGNRGRQLPAAVVTGNRGRERARLRSVTFAGIAAAMAEQWGDYIR